MTPLPWADPRNFTWTTDTLVSPSGGNLVMKSIWGSSASDVYAAGQADPPGSPLYHFDGTSWRPVALPSPPGGSMELAQVFGYSGTDIVAVGGVPSPGGEGPLVLHYDGALWSVMNTPPGGKLNAVWGSAPGEMWVAGASGTMFHYTAFVWLPAIVPDSATCLSLAGISTDDIYALVQGRGRGGADSSFHALWHWNGGLWAVADSLEHTAGRADRFGTQAVWSLLAIVFTVGEGLFMRDGSGWKTLVSPPGNGYLHAVNGAVASSLFLVGDGSVVIHVGATDYYRYPQFTSPSISLTSAWTNQREAFIVGSDGHRSYVLHGK